MEGRVVGALRFDRDLRSEAVVVLHLFREWITGLVSSYSQGNVEG